MFSVTTTFGVPVRDAVRTGSDGVWAESFFIVAVVSFGCEGEGSGEEAGGFAVSGIGSG